jgi:hypothetical protein
MTRDNLILAARIAATILLLCALVLFAGIMLCMLPIKMHGALHNKNRNAARTVELLAVGALLVKVWGMLWPPPPKVSVRTVELSDVDREMIGGYVAREAAKLDARHRRDWPRSDDTEQPTDEIPF